MTYSLDFRIKVFEVKAREGFTYEETAKYFGIGKTTLVRWQRRLYPLLSRNKSATAINMDLLKEDVEKYPDSYQYERAERFKVSQMCIHYALKRLGVSYKKNSKTPKGKSRKSVYILPNN